MRSGIVHGITEKGFGFIEPIPPETDRFFFHANDVEGRRFDSMFVGMHVEFDVDSQSDRGPRCRRVRIVQG